MTTRTDIRRKLGLDADPAQITEDELKHMTDEEIVYAQQHGNLNQILGANY